ncbi:MAG: hypothetical protein ACX93I_08950 [Winogradskyella sp.]|jgi:hypothetical protein
MTRIKHTYIVVITMLMLAYSSYAQDEAAKVRETCNTFIRARKALKQGDSLLIKSVTEDSLYKLLMLNHKYAKMLKTRILEADLNIWAKSVEVNDSCGSCQMSGYEYYNIKVCKYDGKWKVMGENDIYATTERIQRAQQKIVNYKREIKTRPAVDSILRVVNQFFKDAHNYFETETLEPLSTTCNVETIRFIQKLYGYAKERTGLELLHKEMNAPSFLVGDVIFEADRTLFKFSREDIYIVLRKPKDTYMIHGFNKMDAEAIDDDTMAAEYLNLLRSMKLIRQPRYRDKALH